MPVYCWKEAYSMGVSKGKLRFKKKGIKRKENTSLYSRCWESKYKVETPKSEGKRMGGSPPPTRPEACGSLD